MRRSPMGVVTSVMLVLIALAMLPPLYALRVLGDAVAKRTAPAVDATRRPGAPLAIAADAMGRTRRDYFAVLPLTGNAEQRARQWIP